MLVDDVLSELDARRRDALQDLLTGEGQVFLTTADEDQARQMQEVALYVVRPGTVSAVGQSD
jgi:recombinational DNA repair ATPase RecF